jgi:Toastrack DUF4097
MPEFDCPNPVPVAVKLSGGALDIVAEERDTAPVTVSPWDGSDASRSAAGRTTVGMRDGRLVVEAPDTGTFWLLRNARVRVDIRVPLECPLTVKVASAEARCRGRYGDTRMTGASGDVAVEHIVGDATITTASGHVLVGRVDGSARVKGASGDVTVNLVGGDVEGHTASGDLTVDDAGGSVVMTSASGDLQVGCLHRGKAQLKSASGAVRVGVAQGTGAWLDIDTASGRASNGLAMGGEGAGGEAQLNLTIRTASGNVEIQRVAAPAVA